MDAPLSPAIAAQVNALDATLPPASPEDPAIVDARTDAARLVAFYQGLVADKGLPPDLAEVLTRERYSAMLKVFLKRNGL